MGKTLDVRHSYNILMNIGSLNHYFVSPPYICKSVLVNAIRYDFPQTGMNGVSQTYPPLLLAKSPVAFKTQLTPTLGYLGRGRVGMGCVLDVMGY